jgi:hypothetical protein
VIALTIKVNNIPKQNIEIFAKNVHQEIGVTNIVEQKIDMTDHQGSQKINVENAIEQTVDIEQDVLIVPVYEDVPLYEGEYEVTPKVTEQTIPTAQKFLARDVTIEKIPYFEVSNNSGGTTASIGEV